MDMENIDFNWGKTVVKSVWQGCVRACACVCGCVRVRRGWRTRDQEVECSSKQLRDSLAARVLMRGNSQLRSTLGVWSAVVCLSVV